MPISTQQVQVAECDGCGTKRYSENGTFAAGVQGHAKHVDERGSEKNVKWFSCRPDAGHIGKSVAAALKRYQPEAADQSPTPPGRQPLGPPAYVGSLS